MLSTILEFFQNAFPVSKVEEKTTGLFYQIIDHLVKLYKYHDPQNINKHLNDIDTWIQDCMKIINKSKSKIRYSKLERWYKIDQLESYIKYVYETLDKKYSGLKVKKDIRVVATFVISDARQILRILEIANRDLYKAYKMEQELLAEIKSRITLKKEDI